MRLCRAIASGQRPLSMGPLSRGRRCYFYGLQRVSAQVRIAWVPAFARTTVQVIVAEKPLALRAFWRRRGDAALPRFRHRPAPPQLGSPLFARTTVLLLVAEYPPFQLDVLVRLRSCGSAALSPRSIAISAWVPAFARTTVLRLADVCGPIGARRCRSGEPQSSRCRRPISRF
jgi:hypothetical protein